LGNPAIPVFIGLIESETKRWNHENGVGLIDWQESIFGQVRVGKFKGNPREWTHSIHTKLDLEIGDAKPTRSSS